ncbi:unnamed protein product, partial [Porites evermanni]
RRTLTPLNESNVGPRNTLSRCHLGTLRTEKDWQCLGGPVFNQGDRRLMEAVEEASTPLDDTTQEQGDIHVLACGLQLICLCCCICNGDAGTVDQVVSDTTFVIWIDLGKGDELVNLMVVKS